MPTSKRGRDGGRKKEKEAKEWPGGGGIYEKRVKKKAIDCTDQW